MSAQSSLRPKLHYTDTGYELRLRACCTNNTTNERHQRASSQQFYNKFATSQCQSPTSRHVKMLGCGIFLSVGGEFVVQQVVELLWARSLVVFVAGVRVVEFGPYRRKLHAEWSDGEAPAALTTRISLRWWPTGISDNRTCNVLTVMSTRAHLSWRQSDVTDFLSVPGYMSDTEHVAFLCAEIAQRERERERERERDCTDWPFVGCNLAVFCSLIIYRRCVSVRVCNHFLWTKYLQKFWTDFDEIFVGVGRGPGTS